MTKTIALTGATGFVGGHLLDELVTRGFTVKALTRRPQKNIDNVTWISGDFENCAALNELNEDADIIINVAGLVKAKNKNDFLNANSIAVSNLLASIKPETSPHFIQISSLAAREPQLSDYAFSKHDGEKLIIASNQNWTIIRPPGIYGARDTETLKIFKLLKCRLSLFPANRHNRVSWIHVSDLVDAIIHQIDNKVYFGKTLEIDDGKEDGYSHEEFFTYCEDALSVKTLKITTPKFILKIIGHINDILGRIFNFAPMVSSKKVNELCHPDWVCRKNDEFQLTDWKAKITLKEGLKETLDWYKNNEYI